MAATKKKAAKAATKASLPEGMWLNPRTNKVEKLSKTGRWLNSGGPVGEILDMRAVLR